MEEWSTSFPGRSTRWTEGWVCHRASLEATNYASLQGVEPLLSRHPTRSLIAMTHLSWRVTVIDMDRYIINRN